MRQEPSGEGIASQGMGDANAVAIMWKRLRAGAGISYLLVSIACCAIVGTVPASATPVYGSAFANCIKAGPAHGTTEVVTPRGIRVINRTRRRDRQTVRIQFDIYAWFYNSGDSGFFYRSSSPWFRTRLRERRGKRRSSRAWRNEATGQRARWATLWDPTTANQSHRVKIDIRWYQGGKRIRRRYRWIPSHNYDGTWAADCYEYAGYVTGSFVTGAPYTYAY